MGSGKDSDSDSSDIEDGKDVAELSEDELKQSVEDSADAENDSDEDDSEAARAQKPNCKISKDGKGGGKSSGKAKGEGGNRGGGRPTKAKKGTAWCKGCSKCHAVEEIAVGSSMCLPMKKADQTRKHALHTGTHSGGKISTRSNIRRCWPHI